GFESLERSQLGQRALEQGSVISARGPPRPGQRPYARVERRPCTQATGQAEPCCGPLLLTQPRPTVILQQAGCLLGRQTGCDDADYRGDEVTQWGRGKRHVIDRPHGDTILASDGYDGRTVDPRVGSHEGDIGSGHAA